MSLSLRQGIGKLRDTVLQKILYPALYSQTAHVPQSSQCTPRCTNNVEGIQHSINFRAFSKVKFRLSMQRSVKQQDQQFVFLLIQERVYLCCASYKFLINQFCNPLCSGFIIIVSCHVAHVSVLNTIYTIYIERERERIYWLCIY